MKNHPSCSVVNVGDFDQLARSAIAGKCFLSQPAGLTGCEISINRIPAGLGLGFTHHHKQNEEIYIVVAGSGTFFADNQEIPLQAGTVVRLSPAVVRTLKASANEPLDYLCFQAPEGGMPYGFLEDGVPDSTDVPYPNRIPLPPPLSAYFAQKSHAAPK